MGGTLSEPVRSKIFERCGNKHLSATVCGIQGYQSNMEDSYLLKIALSAHPDTSLFGIFDGYKSSEASDYLAKELAKRLNELKDLRNSKEIQNLILKLDQEYCNRAAESEASTILFALVKTIKPKNKEEYDRLLSINSNFKTRKEDDDEQKPFLNGGGHNNNAYGPSRGVPNANDPSFDPLKDPSDEKKVDGDADYLFECQVFWAGDSRAIWIPKETFAFGIQEEVDFRYLTDDHVPSKSKEKNRIQDAGGEIEDDGKINSDLTISRAFGSSPNKENSDLSWENQIISSECDVQKFVAKPGDGLLLFSHGLAEKYSHEKLVRKLLKHLGAHKHSLSNALASLVDEVLDDEAKDNISVSLVRFHGKEEGKNIANEQEYRPGRLHFGLEEEEEGEFEKAYIANFQKYAINKGLSETEIQKIGYKEELKCLRAENKLTNDLKHEIEEKIRCLDDEIAREKKGNKLN